MTTTIQILKKVTLSLIADNTVSKPGKNNQTSSPVIFEFIYGVASVGLCPFENALYDKREGESLTLSVSTSEAHEFFGHLFLPLRQALGLDIMPAAIYLKIEVMAVNDAESREVVQSLAQASSGCGGGGSCGCGC